MSKLASKQRAKFEVRNKVVEDNEDKKTIYEMDDENMEDDFSEIGRASCRERV